MAQAGVVNDSFLCESTKQKLLDHSMSLTKRALRETMDVFSHSISITPQPIRIVNQLLTNT